MAYTVDQIEKHTIVMRLALSIYKMNDRQLKRLLASLAHLPAGNDQRPEDVYSKLVLEKDADLRRQMMIAKIFVLLNALTKDELLERLRSLNDAQFQWVREYPRLPCYLLVDFASHGKAYRSCIRDISANGVFIETLDLFETGQEVALCFMLTDTHEPMPFKVKGRVTRIYADGIGVKYEKISYYQREILKTLIHKLDGFENSPDPALHGISAKAGKI